MTLRSNWGLVHINQILHVGSPCLHLTCNMFSHSWFHNIHVFAIFMNSWNSSILPDAPPAGWESVDVKGRFCAVSCSSNSHPKPCSLRFVDQVRISQSTVYDWNQCCLFKISISFRATSASLSSTVRRWFPARIRNLVNGATKVPSSRRHSIRLHFI